MDPEELLTFSQAAALLPRVGGRKIHCSTIYRWYANGAKGIRLKCTGLGRRLFVTRAALQEFMIDVAAAGPQRRPRRIASAAPPKGRTDRQRDKAIGEAEAYLRKNGAL